MFHYNWLLHCYIMVFCNRSLTFSTVQVVTGTKDNALYLWIHLSPKADRKKCAKVVANLQSHVDAVCPPDLRDEDDEIWAGVGFGPNFFCQVTVFLFLV